MSGAEGSFVFDMVQNTVTLTNFATFDLDQYEDWEQSEIEEKFQEIQEQFPEWTPDSHQVLDGIYKF